MADRSNAALFGKIFKVLAENVNPDSIQLARKIFEITLHYDFQPYQMGADEECTRLLIRDRGIHAEYPDEGEQDLWPNDRRLTIEGFAELCEYEPRLRKLEEWADKLSRKKGSRITDEWPDLYRELNKLIGWCRPDAHPILSTSMAWGIAYPYLWDLSRG